MADINAIKSHILQILEKGLSDSLTYHNINHTLDVEKQILISSLQSIQETVDFDNLYNTN